MIFSDSDNNINTEIEQVLVLENRDKYVKEIGDRVKVFDYPTMTKSNGNYLEYEDFVEIDDDDLYFIVTETQQKNYTIIQNSKYLQDIVIVNPQTNKMYRINSGHLVLHIP